MKQRKWGLLVFFILMGTVSAFSRANPMLSSVYPIGGQRGGEIVVTLSGTDLDGAQAALLSHGDVKAEILDWKPNYGGVQISGGGLSGNISGSQQIKVKLTLPKSASLDPMQLRIQTPHGVSNPVTFYIDDLPERMETEPNGNINEASLTALPAVINGTISPQSDEDHFLVQAYKGQRLIFDVQATRIGSPLDSFLTLYDEKGTPMARNDIANGLDALIDYEVPNDGVYRLAIQDLRYQGGEDFFYRLRAGALPYMDSIFPLGGRSGGEGAIALLGRNLEGISSIQIAMEPGMPRGPRAVRVTTPSGLSSNPKLFWVDEWPDREEKEPNSEAKQAEAVSIPGAVNGRVGQPGDEDVFSFAAKAGQRLVFEIYAQRLGSPLDAVFTLQNEKGEALQISDDAAGSDPRMEYDFTEDGTYRLFVRDLNREGSPEAAYRLAIHTPQPDFNLSASPDNPRVYAGTSVPLTIALNAQDGFSSPVQLSLQGVPESFRLEPYALLPMQGNSLVTLYVPPDAKPGLHVLQLMAEAAINGQRVKKPVQPGLMLTVMDNAPFSLQVVDLAATLVQDKSASLRVQVKRNANFESPIQLTAVGLPKNITASSPVLNTGQNSVEMQLYSVSNAAAGDFSFTVRGSASIQAQPVEVFSSAIPLRSKEAPFVLDSEPKRLSIPLVVKSQPADVGVEGASPEAALTEEVEIKVKVERNGYFTGPVKLTPKNLPEGIVLTAPEIPEGENEIGVKLAGRVNLKPDSYSIQLVGRINVNGSTFEQNVPGVEVKFIPVEITAGP